MIYSLIQNQRKELTMHENLSELRLYTSIADLIKTTEKHTIDQCSFYDNGLCTYPSLCEYKTAINQCMRY